MPGMLSMRHVYAAQLAPALLRAEQCAARRWVARYTRMILGRTRDCVYAGATRLRRTGSCTVTTLPAHSESLCAYT